MKHKRMSQYGLLLGMAIISNSVAFSASTEVVVKWMHPNTSPEYIEFYQGLADHYNKSHPNVKVDVSYLDGESYKKKLATQLQSNDKPHIIYSWGGGGLKDQVKAGVIKEITPYFDKAWSETFYPAAVDAFKIDDKQYGVPFTGSQVGFYYNKKLFEKIGITADDVKTWDDFIQVVKKFKEAGITPLITSGSEKWPLHFYWSHLALRLGGKDAFEKAVNNLDGGFNNPVFVKAGKLFKELIELEPFQTGYIGMNVPQSAGQFGDGKGAMMLQLDLMRSIKANSVNKLGIPDDELGWFSFPVVIEGIGGKNDVLGGLNGWILTEGAPDEAVDFVKYLTSLDNQIEAANRKLFMPITIGSRDAIQLPIIKRVAQNVQHADYVQLYYDQMLGPDVGAVVNDVSVALALGKMTPEEAAATVEKAWQRVSKK